MAIEERLFLVAGTTLSDSCCSAAIGHCGVRVTIYINFVVQGPVSRKSRKLFGPENKYLNRNIKNESASPG